MPEYDRKTIDRINQECYDHCASRWDRFPFGNLIPVWINKFRTAQLDQRVLDIGSGTGVLAKWMADEGFDVLCLDPSQEMVKRCRAHGLNTKQCFIQDYHPETSFGMIFAILSLIHLPKREFDAQLKKIHEALSDQGLFFLAMLEGNQEGIFEGPPFPRFFAYYTKEEILEYTKPYFTLLDYSYTYSGIGYMIFLFANKEK